jgi:hypothetical protein
VKLLQRVVIAAVILALVAYGTVFVLLVVKQREMLFVGGRTAEAPTAPFQVHRIAEHDGTRVTMWQAAARPGAPVIVFFYGNAGTLSDFADVGAGFHKQGFSIVLASYRGYDGNTGSPSEAGLMDDARAILGALPKDHGPVVLWGQSLGSGVAARMASEGRSDLLILESPYTSIADVAGRRFPIYPIHWLMKDPFDTFSVLPKIKVPVLIMHGDRDGVVPFDMGETLTHALGTQATFVRLPGSGHDIDGGLAFAVAGRWLQMRRDALHLPPL